MKKDPKTFFKYAKKFSKSTSDIGPFIDRDGDVISNPEKITEMLREQYESVYSIPMESMKISNPLEFFAQSNASEQLNNVFFVKEDIIENLTSLVIVPQLAQMESHQS